MFRNPVAGVLSILLALPAFTGCSSQTGAAPEAAAVAHDAAHWSYAAESGPSHWGELDEAYALCGSGSCQSPIDIVGAEAVDLPNIAFAYAPSHVNIVDNGHTVQVDYDPGSSIEVDGVRYELLQFHFHAPSEHQIGGVHADAEMHLVHEAANGALAVVALMIESGRDHVAFRTVWQNLPETAGPAKKTAAMVDAALMLPPVQTTYRYGGSLTTPPCSESVSWNIMTTPIEMSASQLAAFQRTHAGNNRPVQPLNARAIVVDATP